MKKPWILKPQSSGFHPTSVSLFLPFGVWEILDCLTFLVGYLGDTVALMQIFLSYDKHSKVVWTEKWCHGASQKVLVMDGDNDCKTKWMDLIPLDWTPKMVKIGNYMLGMFYHSENMKEKKKKKNLIISSLSAAIHSLVILQTFSLSHLITHL